MNACGIPGGNRQTVWRQGDVLTEESAAALGLPADRHHVVISHSCDLASGDALEPMVEVLAASRIEVGAAHLIHGENPRCLHLKFSGQEADLFLELSPQDKRLLNKRDVLDAEPDCSLSLDEKSHRLLQGWLACRYRRHALPNSLNDRLSRAYAKLKATGKKKGEGVIATFIAYSPDEELPDDEPYEVQFKVAYEHQTAGAMENAGAMATTLRNAIEGLEGIDIDPETGCLAMPDSAFTLFDLRQMHEWRLEFLSFRGAVSGPLLEP